MGGVVVRFERRVASLAVITKLVELGYLQPGARHRATAVERAISSSFKDEGQQELLGAHTGKLGALSVPNIEPLATPEPEPVACPNCGARYTLVRAEADRASVSGQSERRSCGGPLNGRESRFILKYLLVDRPKIAARAARGKR